MKLKPRKDVLAYMGPVARFAIAAVVILIMVPVLTFLVTVVEQFLSNCWATGVDPLVILCVWFACFAGTRVFMTLKR
ncbi:MAG: hypothetical protein KDB27_18285 [Planctomycetales bacterium]|nr:hypothetical protein [Planctomycetales bacterium]